MAGLLETIAAVRPKERQSLIIAIDGYGGSGKSTLAEQLALALGRTTIVCTDEFARPDASGWDWMRMKAQVLDPLNRDHPGKYQRRDWYRNGAPVWLDVPVGGTIIVEGVSSMRTELGRYWDLAIWVMCSRERRLKRGVSRDGEAKRSQWENVWIPEEDEYVAAQKPDERADVIVDGEKPLQL